MRSSRPAGSWIPTECWQSLTGRGWGWSWTRRRWQSTHDPGGLTLVPQLKAELEKQGRPDIMIVVGGVVPPQDYDALHAAGAEAIFPPGTVIADAAEELLRKLNRRLGHGRAAAE